MNDIDISGKLDKVIDPTPDFDQAYIKKANGDQGMQNISALVSANTLALRGTGGRLKVGGAVDDNDAVTLRQLKNNLEPFKVKDVTFDGASIVNTETGVVALESTYSITLTGISGTLTQEEYNNLDGDNASYIWYKTEENAAPVRLIKQQKANNDLSYQTISGTTLVNVTIKKDSKAWTWKAVTRTVQLTEFKVTDISDSSTDTQYPSALAVYNYVQTELGKIDQFEYKVSTNAASTPEGIVWYSGATESTKITGTLKASADTEYTIYLVPCKHTASETQKGYDEYLTINNSAGQYVWEVLGNTRDLDLSDYVSKTATRTQIIASDLRIKADNKFTTYGNGTIGYTTDNGVTEYVLNLPQKGGIIAVTEDLKQYVTLEKDEYIGGHKTFISGLTATAIATFNSSATFNEDLTLACPIIINNNAGTNGQVLTSKGAGQAPQWTTIPQGTVKKYVQNITVPAGGTNAPAVTVKHDLNVTGCTVSLYQNNELVMADIQIVDKNNIKVIFGQTFATEQTFQVVVTG